MAIVTIYSTNVNIDIDRLKHQIESSISGLKVARITPGTSGTVQTSVDLIDADSSQQSAAQIIVDSHTNSKSPDKTIITGNLEVEGTQTTIESETITITDNVITLSNPVAYTGVRTSNLIFTASSTSLGKDGILIGKWVYSYVSSDRQTGSWSHIINNVMSGSNEVITIEVTPDSSSLYPGCDRIEIYNIKSFAPKSDLKSGIEIYRGPQTIAPIVFDESDDLWKCSSAYSTLKEIATYPLRILPSDINLGSNYAVVCTGSSGTLVVNSGFTYDGSNFSVPSAVRTYLNGGLTVPSNGASIGGGLSVSGGLLVTYRVGINVYTALNIDTSGNTSINNGLTVNGMLTANNGIVVNNNGAIINGTNSNGHGLTVSNLIVANGGFILSSGQFTILGDYGYSSTSGDHHGNFTVGALLTVGNGLTVSSGNLTVSTGTASISSTLDVYGATNAHGVINASSGISSTSYLTVNGILTATNDCILNGGSIYYDGSNGWNIKANYINPNNSANNNLGFWSNTTFKFFTDLDERFRIERVNTGSGKGTSCDLMLLGRSVIGDILTGGGDNLIINAATPGNDGQPHIFIKADEPINGGYGQVGIGRFPLRKLHAAGTIRADSDLEALGDIYFHADRDTDGSRRINIYMGSNSSYYGAWRFQRRDSGNWVTYAVIRVDSGNEGKYESRAGSSWPSDING